ncbi:protein timeless-like isoform X2 [Mytilus trossulus]
MDWNRGGSHCIMNVGVNSMCSNLGYLEDGEYITSDDCEDTLIELLKNLQEENPIQRAYRRQLCFSRIIELDIIPLIKYVRDQPEIFSAAIRLLASLIQPVECLILGIPVDVTLPWVPDVKRMLFTTRKLCNDKDLIQAIVTEIMTVITDHDGQPMPEETCDFINKCLLVFRNLLYIQNIETNPNQEIIVLYLLESGLGELINRIVTLPQREYWCSSIIQLVSLMYTRQTLDILKPCLSIDTSDEESLSDYEDREHDFLPTTAMCYNDEDDKTSYTATCSLPGLFGKTLHMDESGVTDLDTGQIESSEVNGDQKNTEEDMLTEDLSEENKIEHLRSLLLQFTNDFIINCFGFLVHDLKNVLISDVKDNLDETYFLWAMAFFLKIARKENLPFKVIRLVLKTELFGFLTYQGVVLTEQLLIAQKKKNNLTNNIRRLHLTITALNEILKTLLKCSSDETLEDYDKEYLVGLQKDLANVTELRMVFFLLIRHYQSKDTSLCFLEDLISTNHTYLSLLDSWDRKGWVIDSFNMMEHIKLYANRNIMQYYGTMLENFENNRSVVNLYVFTMMHHIAGDCEKPEVLMQMPIIQALMEIDGSKNCMTKEMKDLKEFLLNRFDNLTKTDPYAAAMELYGIQENKDQIMEESVEDTSGPTDSAEVDDMLFALYTELQNTRDMVDTMVDRFADIGITINAQQVWSRLYDNGLIDDTEYFANKKLVTVKDEIESKLLDSEDKDVIQWCVNALKEKKQDENLKWIQTLLCETAYVRLGKQCERNLHCQEPVTMFHVVKGSSVPLVIYKEEQEPILHDEHFTVLLHYLGFHTPQDVDMIFPRIPSFWTSEQLIQQAEKLGPISSDILKFDPTSVKYEDEQFTFSTRQNETIYSNSKEISVHRPMTGGGDNNIFWLKQIQQYNQTKQRTTSNYGE